MTVGEDREGTASVVWPLLATGPGRGPPGPSDSAIARLLGIAGSPGPGRGRPGGAVQVRRVLVVYHGRPGGRRFGRGPGRRPGGGGGLLVPLTPLRPGAGGDGLVLGPASDSEQSSSDGVTAARRRPPRPWRPQLGPGHCCRT